MREEKIGCFYALQNWYLSQCNGEWEHKYGVKIDTLDNPGWMIKIDISGTLLKDKEFEEVDFEKAPGDWIQCNIENDQFQGFGGPRNLGDVVNTFLLWGEGLELAREINEEYDLFCLQKWYQSQCNGDWEHEFGITIKTINTPGWHTTINLLGTALEGVPFKEIKEEQDDLNWYFCLVRNGDFEGFCDPCNLNRVLQIFREWVESCEESEVDQK